MIKLEKGAKVRVRLHTGEVVDAVYDSPDTFADKAHWVERDGWLFALVWGKPPQMGDENGWPTARFVGPPCDHLPVGVSV